MWVRVKSATVKCADKKKKKEEEAEEDKNPGLTICWNSSLPTQIFINKTYFCPGQGPVATQY